MSTVPLAPMTALREARIDRFLAIVEKLAVSTNGMRVQLHAAVVATAIAVSVAAQATIGLASSIERYQVWWVASAIVVAFLQGFGASSTSERVQSVAGVSAAMLFFAFGLTALVESPSSYVAYGMISLSFWSGLPTLRPLFAKQ